MWNALRSLFPKPPAPEERLWRLVIKGLESDAKLLASGLDSARRPAAGRWGTALIECEIAALRAWVGCAALSTDQSDGEALIRSFEARFRTWLEQQRSQPLSSYATLSRTTLPETVTSLSEGWRRYDALARATANVTPETLADLVSLFWGRCIEGYTGRQVETFASQGETQIDRFMRGYVSVQLQLANAGA